MHYAQIQLDSRSLYSSRIHVFFFFRFKRACASPTRRCRSELANTLNGDVPGHASRHVSRHVSRQTFDATGPPNGPYLSCSTFDPIHIFYSSAAAVCALRMCKRGLPLAMTTGISWISDFCPLTRTISWQRLQEIGAEGEGRG